jgi:polyphosphate kinase
MGDKRARIIFKMNSLVDKGMIKLLYKASQAGVEIDLFVRGICCLRPGINGLSDNIRVVSILGRFLEHSRVYYFNNGGEEEVYMGSADLMPRNLNRRVEVVFPVEDPNIVREIKDNILDIYNTDNVKARRMTSDGKYIRPELEPSQTPINSQEWFMNRRIEKSIE